MKTFSKMGMSSEKLGIHTSILRRPTSELILTCQREEGKESSSSDYRTPDGLRMGD